VNAADAVLLWDSKRAFEVPDNDNGGEEVDDEVDQIIMPYI
jgi:hypothetical protein